MSYEQYNPYDEYNRQLAVHYLEQMAYEMGEDRQDTVGRIMQIFLTRRQDVLQLIEAYGVPRWYSRLLTERIVRFVVTNAPQIPGTLEQKTRILYDRYIVQDPAVPFVLRLFKVPENTIQQYIMSVIRVTLRNLDGAPGPGPDIPQEVTRILRLFEQQHPNFFGLINLYNIPIAAARDIARGIIRFTLVNINRISPYGNIFQRSQEMLLLLDREQPGLIREMINRGVPAQQAENITRQIIAFTLRNAVFLEE